MEKFNRLCLRFVKYLSPIPVVVGILAAKGYNTDQGPQGLISHLGEIAAFVTVLWSLVVLYLFFAVAFNDKLKNAFVRKLARIKENDEREAQITGVVSKKTFISTTGFLVLLLFLSALKISIYRTAKSEAGNGRTGTFEIGMEMPLIAQQKLEAEDSGRVYIFNYHGIPLSSDGTLLLVLLLQMGAFYYFSKKETVAIRD